MPKTGMRWLLGSLVALAAVLPSVAHAQTVHPAEFEASGEILWGCKDTYLVQSVYREAVRGTAAEPTNHTFFVASRDAAYQVIYDMYDRGISLAKAKFFICALDSVWMRDYGPFVVKENGQNVVVDVNYYYNRQQDDAFPRLWARFKGYGYRYGNLDTEGGNFMTDGRGTAFISKSVYEHNRALGTNQINSVYRTMGCSQVQTFEYLLNDGTTHIDMYSKLLGYNTVLVSRAVSTQSMNYALLERNAAKFRSLGFNVVRATMADDNLSTYTNSLVVGGTMLVPTYGSTNDSAALAVYQSAGYRTVGIDCRNIIRYGGAIHCISMQVAK